jgi:hypothetical protein
MEKQTAVEWIFKELLNSEPNILEWNKLLEQAKEMEKQQIIDAFDIGKEYEYQEFIHSAPKFDSEQYYNETFGK